MTNLANGRISRLNDFKTSLQEEAYRYNESYM